MSIRITLSELEKTKRSLPDPRFTRYSISFVAKPLAACADQYTEFDTVSDEIRWRAEVCEEGWTWVSQTPLEVVLS